MYCIYCTLIEAIQGGRSVTHSLSVDSRPTKCSVCCGSKQEAGLFQASALFKGDFIFNVDMYLDFTAKFDVQQPHPSSPPSVAATWWGWPFSPWCGTVPAFPSAYSLRSKGVNRRPAPSPNLPWRSTVTCFLFVFFFLFCFHRHGAVKMHTQSVLLPDSMEGATVAAKIFPVQQHRSNLCRHQSASLPAWQLSVVESSALPGSHQI